MGVLSTVKLGSVAVCANFIVTSAYDTSVQSTVQSKLSYNMENLPFFQLQRDGGDLISKLKELQAKASMKALGESSNGQMEEVDLEEVSKKLWIKSHGVQSWTDNVKGETFKKQQPKLNNVQKPPLSQNVLVEDVQQKQEAIVGECLKQENVRQKLDSVLNSQGVVRVSNDGKQNACQMIALWHACTGRFTPSVPSAVQQEMKALNSGEMLQAGSSTSKLWIKMLNSRVDSKLPEYADYKHRISGYIAGQFFPFDNNIIWTLNGRVDDNRKDGYIVPILNGTGSHYELLTSKNTYDQWGENVVEIDGRRFEIGKVVREIQKDIVVLQQEIMKAEFNCQLEKKQETLNKLKNRYNKISIKKVSQTRIAEEARIAKEQLQRNALHQSQSGYLGNEHQSEIIFNKLKQSVNKISQQQNKKKSVFMFQKLREAFDQHMKKMIALKEQEKQIEMKERELQAACNRKTEEGVRAEGQAQDALFKEADDLHTQIEQLKDRHFELQTQRVMLISSLQSNIQG